MKQTNQIPNTPSERPLLLTFLILLCPAILCGALVLLRAELTNSAVILAIAYICRLLSLLVGFFGLGCAFRAANRGELLRGVAYLAVSAASYGVMQLIAAVREILYFVGYPDYLTDAIIINLGAALGNVFTYFLPYFVVYVIMYLAFFHKKAALTGELPFFSLRDRRALAGLLATAALFFYQFILQLINTLSVFLDEFGPTMTQIDVFYIVADYAFLLLSMLVGYATLNIVQGHIEE